MKNLFLGSKSMKYSCYFSKKTEQLYKISLKLKYLMAFIVFLKDLVNLIESNCMKIWGEKLLITI